MIVTLQAAALAGAGRTARNRVRTGAGDRLSKLQRRIDLLEARVATDPAMNKPIQHAMLGRLQVKTLKLRAHRMEERARQLSPHRAARLREDADALRAEAAALAGTVDAYALRHGLRDAADLRAVRRRLSDLDRTLATDEALRRNGLEEKPAADVPGLIRTLRPDGVARASDLAALVRIHDAAFGGESPVDDYLRDSIANSNVLVARDGAGNPVGMAILSDDLRGTGHVYLSDLAVDRRWRNRGIGTRLLHDAQVIARAAEARGVALDVRADNPNARRLYERLGFKPVETVMERNFE